MSKRRRRWRRIACRDPPDRSDRTGSNRLTPAGPKIKNQDSSGFYFQRFRRQLFFPKEKREKEKDKEIRKEK